MLKHPNHKVRNTIIQTTEDPVITCICECVANLLYGCVPVNTKEKKELANHALIMRKLVKRNIRVADKRKILKQSGGFLPALLGPILGIASGLIADLFWTLIYIRFLCLFCSVHYGLCFCSKNKIAYSKFTSVCTLIVQALTTNFWQLPNCADCFSCADFLLLSYTCTMYIRIWGPGTNKVLENLTGAFFKQFITRGFFNWFVTKGFSKQFVTRGIFNWFVTLQGAFLIGSL